MGVCWCMAVPATLYGCGLGDVLATANSSLSATYRLAVVLMAQGLAHEAREIPFQATVGGDDCQGGIGAGPPARSDLPIVEQVVAFVEGLSTASRCSESVSGSSVQEKR